MADLSRSSVDLSARRAGVPGHPGTITDASGAIVPNAQVSVLKKATSAVATASANEAGVYTVPFLVPGAYRLTVTAAGCKQTVRDDIEIHATDRVQANPSRSPRR